MTAERTDVVEKKWCRADGEFFDTVDFVRLNDGVWLHVRTAEQGHDRDSGTETRGLHASQQADGSWVVEEPVRWVTDIEEDAESNEGDDFA